MVRLVALATIICSLPCWTSNDLFGQTVNWFPINRHIKSEWAQNINPTKVYDVHPAPGLRRKEWKSLDGLWQFDIREKEAAAPQKYEKNILVPFAPESDISGVGVAISPDQEKWYKRQFFVPEEWSGKLILLHIGASDWETTVYINGEKVGLHRGGFDPIKLDITYFLKEKGQQDIALSIWDPTDHHHQPRGKQSTDPRGIWYTSVSGIWQSIWIEPAGTSYINDIQTTVDVDRSQAHFMVECKHALAGDHVRIAVEEDDNPRFIGDFGLDDKKSINIIEPKLWTPDNPFLYNFTVELIRDGAVMDRVQSYFGLRKISTKTDARGYQRIYLNDEPIFLLGVLDQGWWPGGLYTAPSPEAMNSDLLMIKKMGFNTVRKHVKVEPDLWYYYCDRAGLLVWQDMPNGDEHAKWKPPSGIDGVEIDRSFNSEAQYKLEFKSIINHLYDHPSIIYWTPFNEGWGQFKTVEITNWVKELDPTRIVGGPSGGNHFPVGDTRDHHQYPGPALPTEEGQRALVLGEFGGLGYPVKGHTWNSDEDTWSYQQFQSARALEKGYAQLMEQLPDLMRNGLCAAIYTQLTDVENEVNGLLTYDRKVQKIKPSRLKRIHSDLLKTYSNIVK